MKDKATATHKTLMRLERAERPVPSNGMMDISGARTTNDKENNSQVALLEVAPLALLTTAAILDRDGWTKAAITKFLVYPDSTEKWKYRGHGSGLRFFYRMDRVLTVEAQPEFAEWRRKKVRRDANVRLQAAKCRTEAQQAEDVRLARLAAAFPNWQDALPVACGYLFELNRYAKHKECETYQRNEIYGLKNDLIRVLYEHGYATDCYQHYSELPVKPCFGCDGTGWSDLNEYSDRCHRCGGSGIFAPPKSLTFVVFRFRVGERAYCWHQPEHLVEFAFAATQAPSAFDLINEEKVVSLPTLEFGKAEELIRWVIVQSTAKRALAA